MKLESGNLLMFQKFIIGFKKSKNSKRIIYNSINIC